MRKVSRFPYACSAVALALFYGFLLSWSLFRPTLLEMYPSLTAGDLSVVYSMHLIFVAIPSTTYRWIRKKLQPHVINKIAAVCLGGGVFLFSFLPEGNDQLAYFLMILSYGVIGPIGVGLSQSTGATTYVEWFPDRIGLIAGLILMSFTASPLILGAAATVLIDTIGFLPTFKVIGIAIFAVMFVSSHWTVLPPKDVILPEPKKKRNENISAGHRYTVKEVLRSPAFWGIFIFSFCVRGVSFTMSDYAATIASAYGMAAIFGMIFSPAGAIACVLFGGLVDRFGALKMLLFCTLLLLGSCAVLILSDLLSLSVGILLGLLGIGVIFGGAAGVINACLRILYGEENYSLVYSLNAPTTLIAAFVVILGGRVLDALGGNFMGVFIMMTAFSALGLTAVATVRKNAKKSKKGSLNGREATAISS